MSELKVLVSVEDDPDMRFLIRTVLSNDGRLTVESEAETAVDAIEAVRTTQPDLVILDHFILGRPFGLEAAPEIKAASPTAKILLFSSHDLAVEARREPAIDGFLRKDHIDKLLDTVRELIGLEPVA